MKLQGTMSQGFQLLSLYSKFSSLLNWLLSQFFTSYSSKQEEQIVMLLYNTIHLKCFIFHADIFQYFFISAVVPVQVEKCGLKKTENRSITLVFAPMAEV